MPIMNSHLNRLQIAYDAHNKITHVLVLTRSNDACENVQFQGNTTKGAGRYFWKAGEKFLSFLIQGIQLPIDRFQFSCFSITCRVV
ncbi:hypothetical protein HY3_09220 [Hyphomonas pacifica]|uniref:Uncharacterized protein n=1 Tax=Hyphomonas pacifica TaxID=1280941 RepID=A0A062TVY5_9PROT|nr:hypothetical protein HY2_09095 [Hyphomonas pacifica]RAN35014.1 hypothetical protein HY3_09220 [Hyphomonas pacifica]